jgi:L-asparaginase/Glu-tRNA(Gln) amidotransferase subunit D
MSTKPLVVFFVIPQNQTFFQVLVLYTGGTIGMVRNKDGVLVPQPHAMENKIRAMVTMHDEVRLSLLK